MRPLDLSLVGFTSFRTEQHLSFDELDLFAITGPTGAGKSSLLDAMTFALYGHTMRSGKIDSELVSQGASEMKVSLRFLVRGVVYRITRTWRFRPSLPDVKVRLEHLLPDGQWDVIETKDRAVAKAVERIVGMDYDTFTRVILLPQGKFDEFLKGDAPKRRELLRQLGGHEIFERMRTEAAVRSKVAKSEREGLAGQLEAQAVPGAHEIEARTLRLADAEASLPGLAETARQAAQRLDEEATLFKHAARLVDLRAEWAQLQAQEPAMTALHERLEVAQRADRLQGPWTRLQEARRVAAAAVAARAAAATRLVEAAAAEQTAATALHDATTHTEATEHGRVAREAKLHTARGLDEQRAVFARDLTAAEQASSLKQRALVEAETAVRTADAQAEQTRAAAEAAEATLAGYVPPGPRLTALNDLAPVMGEWNSLVKQAREVSRKLKAEQAELVASETAREAALVLLTAADAQLLAARNARAEAQAANEILVRDNGAQALRAHLQAGDACPVCEGVYPGAERLAALAAGALTDVRPLERAEREADTAQRQAQQALVRQESSVDSIRRSLEALGVELDETKHVGKGLRETINAALGETEWTIEALEAERKALTDSQARHQTAAEARHKAESARREAEQAAGFARKGLADAAAAHTEAQNAAAGHAARVGEVDAQLLALTGGVAVATLAAAIEAERDALKTALKAAQQAHQAASTAAAQRAEAARQAEATGIAADAKLEQDAAAWAYALAGAGLDEVAFEAAHATPEMQWTWRSALDTHAAATTRVQALEAEVAALVGDRKSSEEAMRERREASDTAETTLRASQTELAELRAWLVQAGERQAAALALQHRHDEAVAQEQTFTTLSRDLRATDFQAFLLEHLQADLVARATVLLKELTDGRYALVMNEGEFWIEDNWNGGEARRVRTLSGGETFATSLAMALALSEKLSQGAELGSLFLDEGFGTLDPETLESVTQILESLRQRNRLIGVITHVRSLGERLPTQVRVSKSPQGSKIVVEAL